ncbi:hypothetical protein FQN60_009718 [Etheostoma spectabile]|uniref:Phosphatidylinositol glycan anchor biosynthesis class U protein n=1 Tax=Etheostoma spectabile TaxID=54343 RepID=A0A5J5DJY8_9PERO|nr:hypothetical protein FQN60_009718 [Etheostoma spectabile]
MAAPLTLLVIVAVTVRAALYRSSLAALISERVEVTPLIIYCFHFLVDYAEITFMLADVITAVALYLAVKDYNKQVFRKQKYALEADRYPLDCLELIRSPKEMYYIPLKVAMFYLLNPFTILSCVAKSTCGLNNAVIALFILSTIKGNVLLSAVFLSLATYQSIYPLTLCAAALLYLMQRQYIPVNYRRASFWWFLAQYGFMYLGSLFVIVCLSFFLLGSWDYLPSMFEHFRLFFLCVFQINVFFYTVPLSIKLKDHPVFLIFMQLAVISIFKSYPTVGDIALYLAFLPVWSHLHRFLRNIFLVSCVLLACSALFPVLWHLWIYAGSANSNFYYAITLLFNVAQSYWKMWEARSDLRIPEIQPSHTH